MSIEHLRLSGLPAPASPFSHVVTDGYYAHLSGMLAADLAPDQVCMGDIRSEAGAVMRAMEAALAELGLGMANVVRVEVHLRELRLLEEFDRVYATFFEAECFPARTAVGGVQLYKGCLVEIGCTACMMGDEGIDRRC